MKTKFLAIVLTAILTAFASNALAGNFQYAAIGDSVIATNGLEVAEWRGNAGSSLFPLHCDTNGWGGAVASSRSVCFREDSTPFLMSEATTSLVSRVFIVATATNLAERSSLLFPSTSLWLVPGYGGMTLAPEMPTRATVAVDGLSGGHIVANRKFLAEVELSLPVAACDVFVGGHAATPVWRRGWQGEIHEVVLLGTEVTQAEATAVRALLSCYWGTQNALPSPPDAAMVLRGIGLSHHGLYATTFLTH